MSKAKRCHVVAAGTETVSVTKIKRRIRESGVGSEILQYINASRPVCDVHSCEQTYFQCGSKTGRSRRSETGADL